MKVSELSSRSGVAIPTIKFYLREGLLAPGALTSPNQASYDDSHLARLTLVRALIDVGGLSVASVRRVLAAVDDTGMPLDWAFGVAQHALPGVIPEAGAEDTSFGTTVVEALLAENGWRISADNPGRATAARVLSTYDRLGHGNLVEVLPAYLRAAEIVAEADLGAVATATSRAEMVETVVVGTVLGDSLLAGLRRIAQERASDQHFPVPGADHGAAECDAPEEEK